MDLEMTCKYITMTNHRANKEQTAMQRIAQTYDEWKDNQMTVEFVLDIFENSKEKAIVSHVDELLTPVSDKKWTFSWNPANTFVSVDTPRESSAIYDGWVHYIYIHSEVEGRYGDTYWYSNNCSNHLNALPCIKAFKEFNFEVGHFYKIKLVDTITWGNNRKKYVFDIKEVDEEKYMKRGFLMNARSSYSAYQWG